MKNILLISVLWLCGATVAEAQRDRRFESRSPHTMHYRSQGVIEDLQRDVRRQISWGTQRNLLSRREAKQFLREYDRIAVKEKRFLRGNRMTRKEANEIIRDLERLKHRVAARTRTSGRNNWARTGRY